MQIRIGILLDSTSIPRWQARVLEFIANHPQLSVGVFIINQSTRRQQNSNRFLYKLGRRVERSFFSIHHDNFSRVNIDSLLAASDKIYIDPIQTRYKDEFPPEAIAEIRKRNPDLLLRFGFRVLTGDILNAAKFGIWSLHHGDNEVNRGGPPAFWEIVKKHPVTGATLQVLTESLDAGNVLAKTFIRTDLTSFNRNQNAIFTAGIELITSSMHKLTLSGEINSESSDSHDVAYYHPLYKDPSNLAALRIYFKFLTNRVLAQLGKMFKRQQWRLMFYTGKETEPPMYKFQHLVPPAGIDWADPFVVRKGDNYYVFFEELIKRNKKAHISCLEFSKSGALANKVPRPVVVENHHLSYPFLFSVDGNDYLLPESADDNSVWLYKCVTFPHQWERSKKLLDLPLYDPTLLSHNNRWYLFGTQRPLPDSSPHQYLHIYSTDNLLNGKWIPHPMNPISRDVRGARPAGRITMRDGKLVRPSQIGAPRYGFGIRFYEIVKLDMHDYKEQTLYEILPHWDKDIMATHTYNREDRFVVVDAQYNT